jgi:hypothetical protein
MLLAQAAAPSATPNIVVFVLVALGILACVGVVLVILVLSFRHARRNREMLHEERLMAVKHGHPLEEPNSSYAKFMHNAFWISFWMVALVPPAAFSAAASATESGERPLSFTVVVWLLAGAGSIAAVVCATVLMLASRNRKGIGEVAWGQGKTEEKDLYV